MPDHLARAVALATTNAQAGGFPFGAVVVHDDEVIAVGVNTARRDADPTGHAETNAIRAACARLGTLDLGEAVVWSSCEPCPLCQAAAALAGVARIVFAASAADAATFGIGRSPALAEMAQALGDARAAGRSVPVEAASSDDFAVLAATGIDRLAPFRAWQGWLEAGGTTGTTVHPVAELRVALTVDDHDAAVTFYRDVLGLPQAADWDSPSGRVRVLDAGRATLELIDAAQAGFIDDVEVGHRVAGPIRVALEVDDSTAVAGRLVDAGAIRLGDPVVTPWGDRNVRVDAPGLQLTLFSSDRV